MISGGRWVDAQPVSSRSPRCWPSPRGPGRRRPTPRSQRRTPCRARDRRRHDRPRERRPRASPPDRHAGARHRRVLLAGRRPRAPEPPPGGCGRDARGRSAPRSGRPVRQAAPLRPPRRPQPQSRARTRGAATVWFYGGDRGRYAARLLAAGTAARKARLGLWGACPRAVWDPLSPATTGPGTVPRSSQPRPVAGGRCDPSYPTVCIPPPPPDLDCADIPYRNFRVRPPDPHHFDGGGDGLGCER